MAAAAHTCSFCPLTAAPATRRITAALKYMLLAAILPSCCALLATALPLGWQKLTAHRDGPGRRRYGSLKRVQYFILRCPTTRD